MLHITYIKHISMNTITFSQAYYYIITVDILLLVIGGFCLGRTKLKEWYIQIKQNSEERALKKELAKKDKSVQMTPSSSVKQVQSRKCFLIRWNME